MCNALKNKFSYKSALHIKCCKLSLNWYATMNHYLPPYNMRVLSTKKAPDSTEG